MNLDLLSKDELKSKLYRTLAALSSFEDLIRTIGDSLVHYDWKEESKTGRFRFIPFYLYDFIYELDVIVKHLKTVSPETAGSLHNYTFYDFGCGLGTKLRLATALYGFQTRGFEIEEKYIEAAQYGYGGQSIERRDLEQLTVRQLRAMSTNAIWYFYSPFSDSKKEQVFEEKLAAAAGPTTIIMPCLASTRGDAFVKDFIPLVQKAFSGSKAIIKRDIYGKTGG